MSNLLGEFRVGFRALVKQPGFTLVAVVTLALGIGANVAIFAVVNGLLLQPLPYANQARLLSVDECSPMFPDGMSVALANYLDWRDRQTMFESMTIFQETSFTLTGVSEPERIQGTLASADLLSTLGVRPISGRDEDLLVRHGDRGVGHAGCGGADSIRSSSAACLSHWVRSQLSPAMSRHVRQPRRTRARSFAMSKTVFTPPPVVYSRLTAAWPAEGVSSGRTSARRGG